MEDFYVYKVLLLSLCHLSTDKSQELNQCEDSSLKQHGAEVFLYEFISHCHRDKFGLIIAE